MANTDITFEQWCIEIKDILYYSFLSPEEEEYL